MNSEDTITIKRGRRILLERILQIMINQVLLNNQSNMYICILLHLSAYIEFEKYLLAVILKKNHTHFFQKLFDKPP